jgi:dTDP-4-dehydrorhamnose 3,5-epimerase
MEIKKTPFEGLLEVIPQIFADSRGNFFENYNREELLGHKINEIFPLEFQSVSKKGVIRGLHFQKHPYAQAKLVRVIKGGALDVVVDLRKESPTYGGWFSTTLDDKSGKMLWIPEGFAHGFLALDDDTIMHYKVTGKYDKNSEGGIIWDDSMLAIDWKLKEFGISKVILSDKDKNHPKFSDSYRF